MGSQNRTIIVIHEGRARAFEYKVGKRFVNIVKPDGSRVYPSFEELSGLPSEEVERGMYKKWFKITPSMLREYIEKHLI